MKNKQLYLFQLFTEETLGTLADLKILVNKIEILKDQMILVAHLQSTDVVEDETVVQIKELFKKKFKSFQIKLELKELTSSVNKRVNVVAQSFLDEIHYRYVVFDIETTGLSPIDDMITEIGAVKMENGKVIERYNQLINPERPIPELITDLTGITDEMVKGKPIIKDVIGDFLEFIGEDILVAHNASFDIGFIREKMKLIGRELKNPVLDTLGLSRAVFPTLKSHKLNLVAEYLNISLVNHHRAVDDATATAEILIKILDILKEKGIENFNQISSLNSNKDLVGLEKKLRMKSL